MVDAYTTTAALDAGVTAAYDRLAYFTLREQLFFDRAADVKPTRQTHPGASVQFTLYDEMAPATAPLNESVDVDAVALSDGTKTVTLVEYGNAALTTAKLRGTSMFSVDEDAANLVGFNAGLSMDTIARDVLSAGTNVAYGGVAASRAAVIPTSLLTAALVRKQLAALRGDSVQTFGTMYKAWIHPDVSYDLRSETGAAAWRDPHTYSAPENIWNGSIGAFEGFDFLESPRAKVIADAGSSTTLTDVYVTLFAGRQALAKAFSQETGDQPRVRRGPVTDKLMRFHPIGWYWLGGYGRFREESLRRVETASSIGENA